MSFFTTNIKHPITGEKVKANYIDDYFGKHKYGVVIIGSNDNDKVYNENEIEMLPDEDINDEPINTNNKEIPQMQRVEESIRFYLGYHKIPEPAKTMIISNLLQVFKIELKKTN